MTKASVGNFFEDFSIGQVLRHATPRTLHGGDISLYVSLTGERRALTSSSEFARSLGYKRELIPDLLVFHTVFGKTVPDVSFNAVANLGYADVRFLRPVYPGDTLVAESEVIGLRETSSGKSGIVYVTTTGMNQRGEEVLRYNRWVLVHKKSQDPAGPAAIPELPDSVDPNTFYPFAELSLDRFSSLTWATGSSNMWNDYEVGEKILHPDGMTLEEADHMGATRLYQNTAKVHFNAHEMAESRFGKRLIYGGHIISVAHSLAYTGLENALHMVAWNSGVHCNPSFAGDTIYASSEVLDKVSLKDRPEIGGLRMRLLAYKNVNPSQQEVEIKTTVDGKERYNESVVLDLDYWCIMPKRPTGAALAA